jgi:type I restriction enzyme M protein
MLSARNYSKEPDYIKYYGQELMPSTYNLARMNMFLHGVLPENQHLRNGDTLDADWPTDEETEFDAVTMNPPYSANWSAAEGFLQDERFMDYGGKLAPKSKADYAFLLHGFYHLKQTGTMAIVLPHGVLFRGAAEGTIREILLKNGSIYAVIGLPANMFYNTSIPTCIIVLKKHREGRDVLFIDASNLYEKEKKQNVMKDEHIDKVLALYNDRKTVDKLTYLASFEDIKANDFNLNIPRYVDTSEDEEEIDIVSLTEKMQETNEALKAGNKSIVSMMGELTFAKQEMKEAVENMIKVLGEV